MSGGNLLAPWIPPVPTREAAPAPSPLQAALEPNDPRLFEFLFGPPVWLWMLVARSTFGASRTFADSVLSSVWGSHYTLTYVPNSPSLTPGYLVAQLRDFDIVAVSATTTQEQWVAHIRGAAVGPVGGSTWKTLSTFGDAARAIDTPVRAILTNETRPVYLVGHSYGGAVASVLALIYTERNKDRQIYVRTFGEPKAGDSTFRGFIAAFTNKARYIGEGDPVPTCPPDFGPFGLLLGAGLQPLVTKCREFVQSGTPISLAANGRLVAQAADFIANGDQSLLWPFVVAASVPGNFADHDKRVYADRLRASFGNLPDGLDSGWSDPEGLTRAAAAMTLAGI